MTDARMATAAELAAIRERESKATVGPWRFEIEPMSIPESNDVDLPGVLKGPDGKVIAHLDERYDDNLEPVYEYDGDFAAHTRQDVPTLLRHITYLHGLLAEKRRQGKRGGPLAGRIILMCDQHELHWDHTEPPERCLDCEIDALLTEHRVGREGETRREP